ncbi:hypothetical protein CEXT_642361 [Caerostris extrusa]|uniref:Uncharacterized protein n=1 Tax=Caerostris extrusa TaxID=172846 RepID=A0AAV4V7P0_CAEEX|nr:hypothetical protein CEXT_642361 [Caerostris extrusa]
MPVPSKTMSPEIKCDPIPDEEQNSAFPLDLCMKKQEPTFEVTTSMIASYIPTTTTTVAKRRLSRRQVAILLVLIIVIVINCQLSQRNVVENQKAVPMPEILPQLILKRTLSKISQVC